MTSRVSVCPSARTDCRGGGRAAGQPPGTECLGNFPWHLETHVFLAGNHISDGQWDKEHES